MLRTVVNLLVSITSLVRRIIRRKLLFIDIENPYGIVAKPQAKRLAQDIYTQFKIKEFIGTAYRNGSSDHEQGLALDIILWHFPFAARGSDLDRANSVADFIITKADKYGVSYIVWSNKIANAPTWQWSINIKSTKARSQSELHTNHIHVSFSKVRF